MRLRRVAAVLGITFCLIAGSIQGTYGLEVPAGEAEEVLLNITGETPGETSGELPPDGIPGETPGETSGENAGETPIETPGEKPGETPTETPEEKPAETPTETPEEKPEENPSETPEEKPGENAGETPTDTPTAPAANGTSAAAKKPATATGVIKGNSKYYNTQYATLGTGLNTAYGATGKNTYNITVRMEGIPSFITQEMLIAAIKCQDSTGYPASVTIAQIIQESGYGSYGPGGESGNGLSYLAYKYNNLFGIKGTGTSGSVSMDTGEQTAEGTAYRVTANFRAYNSSSECIEDRAALLQRSYLDLIAGARDANSFAMQISTRWATSLTYGVDLINQMKKYDLYRLDDMTLVNHQTITGRFANPCPGSTVTSTFGIRTAPTEGASTDHKGIDLGTGSNHLPTYAADEGIVVYAGNSNSGGNMVIIDHGNGLVTKYMHHLEIYVTKGQKVLKGQQIGLSGSTGISTGNHLHFQVEQDGTAVDPGPYLGMAG